MAALSDVTYSEDEDQENNKDANSEVDRLRDVPGRPRGDLVTTSIEYSCEVYEIWLGHLKWWPSQREKIH
jgi:hypothetical protein